MGKTEELTQEQPERQVRRHIASSHPRNSFRRQLQRGREEVSPLKTAKQGEEKDADKKKRKKKEKIREPNLIGGGLAIVCIVVVFLLIRAYSHDSPRVAGAKEDTSQQIEEKQAADAKQRIKTDVQKQIEGVKKQAENTSVLDITTESLQADKLFTDLEGAKKMPERVVGDVKKHGERIAGGALDRISQAEKILNDLRSVQKMIMEKIREL